MGEPFEREGEGLGDVRAAREGEGGNTAEKLGRESREMRERFHGVDSEGLGEWMGGKRGEVRLRLILNCAHSLPPNAISLTFYHLLRSNSANLSLSHTYS